MYGFRFEINVLRATRARWDLPPLLQKTLKGAALRVLQNHIDLNLKANSCVARFQWDEIRNQPAVYWQPASLLSCLWLELALAVESKKPTDFKRCKECRRRFDTAEGKRQDSKFCREACRTKNYRERKKEARRLRDKGVSLQIIAKKLQSDPKNRERMVRKMKGSVFKRKLPSGRVVWIASLDIGRDERGTRIRITKSFGRKGEAQDALDEIKRQQRDGLLVKPSPKTVREHFEEWLREHAAMHCSPKTAERYGELLAYVLPNLGDVPLCDLSTLMLERAYNKLRRGGGKGGRPLSARTVKNVHDTVRSALGKALKWKVLGTNPSIDCELPKGENPEARVLEKAEIEWLLDAVRGHPWLYVLFWSPVPPAAAGGSCSRSPGPTSISRVAYWPFRNPWNKPSPACASRARRASALGESVCPLPPSKRCRITGRRNSNSGMRSSAITARTWILSSLPRRANT